MNKKIKNILFKKYITSFLSLLIVGGVFCVSCTSKIENVNTHTSTIVPPIVSSTYNESAGESLRFLVVQFDGRLQPFDTFARNTLHFIYGQKTFNNRLAVDVLMSWILLPDYWNKSYFVSIKSHSLKKALHLDTQRSLFTPNELLQNQTFARELDELKSLIHRKEPLSSYFKSVQSLENKLALYQAFQRGEVPGWFPPHIKKNATRASPPFVKVKPSQKNPAHNIWHSIVQETGKRKKDFEQIVASYVAVVFALSSGDKETLKLKKQELQSFVQAFQKQILVSSSDKDISSKINWEVYYNTINPFHWAWIFYLLGLILLLVSKINVKKYLLWVKKYLKLPLLISVIHKCFSFLCVVSLLFLIGGFCLHTYGIVIRCLLMERPPVTNMYETVIWVPWVAILLALFFWMYQRFFFCFICACLLSLLCLFIVDNADPVLLDGRLEPLQAVLNSSFWLSTHVLVITMSYAAFFLAFIVGDLCLYFFLKGPEKKLQINKCIYCIDRFIQIGVVLLASGTILGGIWADYSWGRFWGWDPKETWALISLLGYLTLLHGRLIGWIKQLGTAMASVLLFFFSHYGMVRGELCFRAGASFLWVWFWWYGVCNRIYLIAYCVCWFCVDQVLCLGIKINYLSNQGGRRHLS